METIHLDATTIRVTSPPNPSNIGSRVTFTATLAHAGSGTPTGMVRFSEGNTVLWQVAIDSTGHASFSTSGLALGTHTITAAYLSDPVFAFSQATDAGSPQIVQQTTTAIKASVNPATFGQAVTFTATVRTGPGVSLSPTGTVTFNDFGKVLGTGTLNGARQATFSTASLAAGNHSITGVYGGDANFTGSTSAPYGETVSRPASASALAFVGHGLDNPLSSAVSGFSAPAGARSLLVAVRIDELFGASPNARVSTAQTTTKPVRVLTEPDWLGDIF